MSGYHKDPAVRAATERYRVQVLERDDYTCYVCGGPADQVDHVYPISKGGETTPDNLAAICAKDNAAKGNKVLTWQPYVNPRYQF